MKEYLQETNMLDFGDNRIQSLIKIKKWETLSEKDKIISIYNYIRDDILFGYNMDDTIKATQVLKDGYGQCNTKGTLFMALLRSIGVPCRLHGFTIDKRLQKGAQTGLIYLLAPKEIIHSWVEVYYSGNWWDTEGLILDTTYLKSLQAKFSSCTGGFCGFGVAADDLHAPVVDWDKNNTYIQSKGIVQDFGIFNAPDDFFKLHQQALSPMKKWLYQNIGRKSMNHNVSLIRKEIK
jgi:hypothetical protein